MTCRSTVRSPVHLSALAAFAGLSVLAGMSGCTPASDVLPGGDFVVGVNLPWVGYGHDVGAAWGDDSVSTAAGSERLSAALDRVAGAEVVRWFVLADGRGLPGSDPQAVADDVEAALALADDRGQQLVPVLFDYLLLDEAEQVDGVQLFGRRDWVADPAEREAVVDRWVAPLAERFADDPRVAAWDLMNEPVWSTDARWPLVPEPVAEAEMVAFLDAVAAPFRAVDGHAPLTVGHASVADARRMALDVELVQVHHYGLLGLPPAGELVRGWADGRPVWVGEFPSAGVDLPRRTRAYADQGYDAALPWSLTADDDATDGRAVEAALGGG